MNSYETLWQPGTDHAGIATQALVERNWKRGALIKLILVEKNLSKRSGSGKTNMVILLLISLKN
jgi:valyl-tRNA synthetase